MKEQTTSKTILLAGASGYLGRYIAKELACRKIPATLLVRNPEKVSFPAQWGHCVRRAKATDPAMLLGTMEGVDTVISTLGITRQKDGLTYWEVDYQANMNLLDEARRAGVRKFVYVAVLNGNAHRHVKILEAKEAFVDALKKSGLAYTIIRPNGFFSDMKDFLQMAEKGRVYLFGDGRQKFNPIHGEDLANVCVEAITGKQLEVNVGGPDILTHNEVAIMALQACQVSGKIVHIPHWVRKGTIIALRAFTGVKTYGPYEFFMTMMAEDAIAPRYGSHRLATFFQREADQITRDNAQRP